jgi:hypothetical protein
LDFIFLCALCSHPATHHPKSHCPFRLNSWGYDMLPLSPKKKKKQFEMENYMAR